MDVRIEPIADEHASRVQDLASDPVLAAMSNLPSPYPPDGARAWIAHVREKRQAGLLYAFGVIDSMEGLVGVCSLMTVDRSKGTAELGYWIGRPYWGRGYATAGARLVLSYGFGELGLAAVHATALPQNVASVRVLEKLGFEVHGPGHADPRGPTMRCLLSGAGGP